MTNERYLRPGRVVNHVVNPLVAWLTRRGVSLSGAQELRVVGRSSGAVRTTPVNLVEVEGSQYLVAPRGTTQWVRNLRVARAGELRVGRRVRPFRAEELSDDAKAPVLGEYLRRWRWEVGQFFPGLSRHPSEAELAAVAAGFPVFAVRAPSSPS